MKNKISLTVIMLALFFSTITYAGVDINGNLTSSKNTTQTSDLAALGDLFLTGQRCARMTNPTAPGPVFLIQLWIGGKIDGNICGAPNWSVTGIRVDRIGKNGELWADYIGTGSCAYNYHLTINSVSPGPIGNGTYCFNDNTTCFSAILENQACDF